MSAEPAVLARNTSYFTFALIAQKVISFLYFTFLARTLGPINIGKYVFALSLTTIFSVLLDLGLAPILTREVARDKSIAERYVRLVFGFKAVIGLIVIGLIVLAINLLGYPEITRQLVYLASIVMLLDSFVLSTYATIRGFQNLSWESIGTIVFQISVAAAGFTVAYFTHDLRFFMGALIFGALVNFIYALWQLKWRFQLHLKPILNWQGWRALFIIAWPFTVAAILIRVYGYIDIIFLSLFSGDRAVGIYSVAYKITFALQFIPTAFSASLFPGFSAYFGKEPQKLGETFARGISYLTVIAVPISFGIVILTPNIIHSIYPAYVESIWPLIILMLSLPFVFICFPVGALLPACNRQKRNTLNLALAATSSIVFNLLLIPKMGPLGAAIASFLSTLVLFTLGWVVARKLVVYDKKWLTIRLLRIVLAGLIMVFVAMALKSVLHFVLVIPLAGLVYAVCLICFKGVTWTEIITLFKVLVRRQTV